MHNAFNEVIDRLIESGMEEYDAIALVTQLLEQEARAFILFDDLFKVESLFIQPENIIN